MKIMSKLPRITRFKKLSRILEVASFLMFCLFLLASIGLFIGGIFVVPSMNPDAFTVEEGDNLRISLDGAMRVEADELIYGENLQQVVSTIMWLGAFIVVLYAIIWRQLKKILETVSNETPFDPGNSSRLKSIGIVLIITAFFVPAAEVLIIASVINSGIMPGISASYQLDVMMLLIGLLVLILSGIFRYGNDLQTEVDELV